MRAEDLMRVDDPMRVDSQVGWLIWCEQIDDSHFINPPKRMRVDGLMGLDDLMGLMSECEWMM